MKTVKYAISLLVVGVILTLSGCMPYMQKVERMPFPEEEYLALPKMGTGTATIRGQAFLKTRSGDVKYAAGTEIFLMPVTSYSNQWYYDSYLPSKPMAKYDSRYRTYIGITIGDGEGRFEFLKVPAGDYYLSAKIIWEYVSGGRYPTLTLTGGVAVKKISVEDGQEIKVILTR